jgi:DNA-binding NarL/FixJ family response regulator
MIVLLIDDHAMFREGVIYLLNPLVDPLDCWQAGSCEEAFDLLSSRPAPDLVLIDLALPGMSGLEGLEGLRERLSDTPPKALSSSDDRDTVLAALDAGAVGFIPKCSHGSVLVGALRLILAKGVYLPLSVFLPDQTLGRHARPARAAGRGPDEDCCRPAGATRWFAGSPRPGVVLQAIRPGPHSAAVRCALSDPAGQVGEGHRPRPRPVTEHGQGAHHRGAARAQRDHAHAGHHCSVQVRAVLRWRCRCAWARGVRARSAGCNAPTDRPAAHAFHAETALCNPGVMPMPRFSGQPPYA